MLCVLFVKLLPKDKKYLFQYVRIYSLTKDSVTSFSQSLNSASESESILVEW